jgi:hypothetical protein
MAPMLVGGRGTSCHTKKGAARALCSNTMPLDALFWLIFALKIAITAAFVVASSLITERAGPLIGSLVFALPASAGPAYAFLAMDYGAEFVAQSAIGGLVITAVNTIFAAIYVVTAQRHRMPSSLAAAFAAWFALAFLGLTATWTFAGAIVLDILAFALCLPLTERHRGHQMPRTERRWFDVPLRVLLVCTLVAAVLGLSATLGTILSGCLAAFPIVLLCITLIFHPRVGGPATAALIANSVPASIGFAAALALLHMTALPLGTTRALCLALTACATWNLALWAIRRRGSASNAAPA